MKIVDCNYESGVNQRGFTDLNFVLLEFLLDLLKKESSPLASLLF